MRNTDNPEDNDGTRGADPTELYFGDIHFPDESITEVQFSNRLEGNIGIRRASVNATPSEELRWDYRAEAKLFGKGSLWLTGICVKAAPSATDGISLELRGPLWRLEQSIIQSLEIFGMSSREKEYWLLKLTDTPVDPPPDLELETELRPFLYAIPLKGLASSKPTSLVMGDSGIVSYNYDTTFSPLLEQLDSPKSNEIWQDSNPKVWGVVLARNLMEAEALALARARLTADLVGFALRTGISHFETRYETELLPWDATEAMTSVSLHPWILLREATTLKGWVRKIPTTRLESKTNLDDNMERIELFADRFLDTHQVGNVHAQRGQQELSKRERKLSTGIHRSLRWLSMASEEGDLRDQFIASWIALEAILDSIEYPSVFAGDRGELKDRLLNSIRQLEIPKTDDNPYSVTTGMIESRLLDARWPTPRKLAIFSRAFGVALQPNDTEIVRELAAKRGNVFHAGDDDPAVSGPEIQQLRYLVERLLVAASIGAYQDLEDTHHDIQFGAIGPEDSAAPMFVDGKEVQYGFHGFQDENGELTMEWLAEGKIYTQKDSRQAAGRSDERVSDNEST